MAPHLTPKELDQLRKWAAKKFTPSQIHARLEKQRERRGVDTPNITNIRKAMNGKTYLRSKPEARGRQKVVTAQDVRKLNAVRKRLIKKAKSEREVSWDDVIRATPGVDAHRTTVADAFQEAGIDVRFRPPREELERTDEQETERMDICGRWRFLPKNYFNEHVDLIIDCKRWAVPTNQRGRAHLKKHRVRGHLRTREEGMKPEFMRPSARKHRRNVGGVAHVCAGVSNGRVVLWEYLSGRWNGARAAALYSGPILRALKKHRGTSRTYKVLEDNDPVGFKSGKARRAKKESGISTMDLPRYSPELMVWDYSLWTKIQSRMDQQDKKGKETVTAFKARLRRTALRLPKAEVQEAVCSMKRRIQAVYDAKGKAVKDD